MAYGDRRGSHGSDPLRLGRELGADPRGPRLDLFEVAEVSAFAGGDDPPGDEAPRSLLLALTKPLDVPVGDQADGKSEECLVDVVASFP
ncbi:hypothetical protein, partial [Streptomyces tauricus]|uniref:hypothetical protein n=1 Tax=Streptomyces tauricus TaxID=68274 RepID=UPI002AD53EDA